ncbi:MAG: Pirin domain protein [Bacteroidota bacterium]|nr:Pirin domain protein [Bacteroidota bacterium]
MKKIIHRAEDRGAADHGWLKAHHSFSFANYQDESKVHFGELRVLNDDVIAAGRGFGMHPHDNMEIVTIPLSGSIKHQDSMGNSGIIRAGDVQIMSAGKGIVHSEFNASTAEPLNLFQIWVFPKVRNIEPRYDQKTFSAEDRKGKFQVLVSPGKEEGTMWVNQDVWFNLGDFSEGQEVSYSPKLKTNGLYLMVVDGEVEVAGETLKKRDAIGISEIEKADIKVKSNSEILIIDVPMV